MLSPGAGKQLAVAWLTTPRLKCVSLCGSLVLENRVSEAPVVDPLGRGRERLFSLPISIQPAKSYSATEAGKSQWITCPPALELLHFSNRKSWRFALSGL